MAKREETRYDSCLAVGCWSWYEHVYPVSLYDGSSTVEPLLPVVEEVEWTMERVDVRVVVAAQNVLGVVEEEGYPSS